MRLKVNSLIYRTQQKTRCSRRR